MPTATLEDDKSVTVKLPAVETRKDIPIVDLKENIRAKSVLKKYENPFSPNRSLVGKQRAGSTMMLNGEERRMIALDKSK